MVALSSARWRPGVALAATSLTPGKSRTLRLALRQNVSYTFIASAAVATVDLDMYVRDSGGKVIAQDQERDGTPILEFRVPRTGNYALQLHLAAGDTAGTAVAVGLLQTGGYSIPKDDYHTLSARFFTAVDFFFTQAEGVSAQWVECPSAWPVMGVLLAEGVPLDLEALRLPTGFCRLAATAGPDVRGATLLLANQTGEIVSRSAVRTTAPWLAFQAAATEEYTLRILPAKSRTGMLLLGFFQ